MVAASAQPARPIGFANPPPISMSFGKMMSGTTDATPPSSVWSSSRSRSQDSQKLSESNRVDAVAANACASPVQPRRSSRCGQSVGNETKLSRCDHMTLLWNWSSCGLELRKLDRTRCAELIAIPVAATTSAPTTSAYRKPWKVKLGSSTVSPDPAST